MGSTAAESSGRHWHALCLVVPPDQPSPASRASVEQLVLSLSRRGLTVNRCGNCFDAMAELVVHERQRRQGKTRDPLVVVLVEAQRQPSAVRLFNAALRHGSISVFWEFQGGQSARLMAFRPHQQSGAEPDLSLTPPPTPIVARGVSIPRAAERPSLRLTHEAEGEPPPLKIAQVRAGDDASEPAAARAPSGGAGGARLTDEELSMLLGEEHDEGPSGGSGGTRG